MPVRGAELAAARAIARAVRDAGGRAFFVGGCVRARFTGEESADIDLEVYGLAPADLKRLLAGFGEPIEKGASFGVFGLRHTQIDVAMPRCESRTGPRHTDFFVSVDPFLPPIEAAGRRDFTMNALMEDAITGEVLDFFGGVADIRARVLRHVRAETFPDDALRVYRCAQFAARLEAEIAPETAQLCRGMRTGALSRERVFGEMAKALTQAREPGRYFEALRELGHLPAEIAALIGVAQNPVYHPEGDVFTHTMQVLNRAALLRERAQRPRDFMLAALCHDLGKAVATQVREDGRITAYGHDVAGVEIARAFLNGLTAEEGARRYVENMVRLHMRAGRMAQDRSKPKKTRALFFESACPEDLILLTEADGGTGGDFLRERLMDFRACMRLPMVTGKDLRAAGIPPGEGYAELLERARGLHFAGLPKEAALADVLRARRERGEG